MKKIIYYLLLFGMVMVACQSCKHEDEEPLDIGYSYFPVNVGHWVIYQVDSTYYDGYYHVVEHYEFLIKEVVESIYLDNQGRPTVRLERYKKTSDTTDWFLKDIWVMNLTSTTAEKVEENNRYIKLIFPIYDNRSWDGNALVNDDNADSFEQDYEYDGIHEPFSINSMSFDSTVFVNQKIADLFQDEYYQVERYAKNVGMIYKRYKSVEKYGLPPEPDSIISGVDYIYTIDSYGDN